MMKKFLAVCFLLCSFPLRVVAQGSTNNPSGGSTNNPSPFPGGGGTQPTSFENPLRFDSLTEFLTEFLRIVIMIAWPFIVLAVIYTGFLFVTAQGNEEKLTTAKRAFLWTIVGALLILGATAILALLQGTIANIAR